MSLFDKLCDLLLGKGWAGKCEQSADAPAPTPRVAKNIVIETTPGGPSGPRVFAWTNEAGEAELHVEQPPAQDPDYRWQPGIEHYRPRHAGKNFERATVVEALRRSRWRDQQPVKVQVLVEEEQPKNRHQRRKEKSQQRAGKRPYFVNK